MKRIAVLSSAIPDAWLAPCGTEVVRRVEYARYAPVPLRAGMCAHLAYLPALLEDVDGIVLATTCDQMRRGAEWLGDGSRVFLFDVPSAPCDALLAIEKARLEQWAQNLSLRGASRPRDARTTETPCATAITIGIIGGHFCGDVERVRDFFAQRGVAVRLWGCEGGEDIGDICQRPNDAFYERLSRTVRERAIDGLVVVRTTWCDIWRAAYARVQETAPVPVTEWVFDGQGAPFPDARSVTRLEAFCELLAAQRNIVGTETPRATAGNHPVSLRLPPLQRRGISTPDSPPLEGWQPQADGVVLARKGDLAALDALPPFPSCLPPAYQGAIARHADTGDVRLRKLAYHLSPASHDLWNFLMTEEERLHDARRAGTKIVGAMKDLGTVPILVNAFENAVAFYPDGAWWLPCFKEQQTRLLETADTLGIGDGFCPVRAMLGAFELGCHFPIPDINFCSAGATCDDFKAIAQRLAERGHAIHFWQMPHVRDADRNEPSTRLSDGRDVPSALLGIVENELAGIVRTLSEHLGETMTDEKLRNAIRRSNRVRALLARIRASALPSLERLICEMLAIHYCSDYALCEKVLSRLADECDGMTCDASRKPVYWINPVADIRMMNVLEDAGGRLCGTDFMFTHALAPLDETAPPLRSLAAMALQDPMTAPTSERMRRCIQDAHSLGAQGIIVSRIPGASHCAFETLALERLTALPILEIEIAPVTDPYAPSIATRLQAFLER